jgi:pimeloyl-ACP methyl ester carboxylesterase
MPTILFIHGTPFDRSMWQPQVDHFTARGWRVLAPDLRGYGAAPVTPGTVTLPEFAADLVALLDDDGTDRAVVCGLSMGGQIAMELVHTYPHRVAGLVLADTSPAAETAQGSADRHRVADEVTVHGMAAYAERLLPGMLAPATIERRPHLARYVLEMMSAAPALGVAAALRGRAERRDYGATLLTLDLPTLVVVGREDTFTPVGEAEATARMLRNGRLVVLDGAGHLPNLEATEAFNAAVERLASAVHPPERSGR